MNNGIGFKFIAIISLFVSIISFLFQLNLTPELTATIIFGVGYIISITMMYDKYEKLETRIRKLEGEK